MIQHPQHVATDSRLLVRIHGFDQPVPARIVGWTCRANSRWCEAELFLEGHESHFHAPACPFHRVYGSALATALVEVLA